MDKRRITKIWEEGQEKKEEAKSAAAPDNSSGVRGGGRGDVKSG